jgi:hypothetical protein
MPRNAMAEAVRTARWGSGPGASGFAEHLRRVEGFPKRLDRPAIPSIAAHLAWLAPRSGLLLHDRPASDCDTPGVRTDPGAQARNLAIFE